MVERQSGLDTPEDSRLRSGRKWLEQMAKHKKIRIRSVLVAQDVRQEASHQQTIVGVYTGVIISLGAPLHMPQLVIRLEFDAEEDGEAAFSFALVAPSKTRLMDQRGTLKVTRSQVNILSIAAAPFVASEPGEYKVQFGVDGEEETVSTLKILLCNFQPISSTVEAAKQGKVHQ
jgi:hypothetical protein